jgi:hypothetical protein
MSGFGSQPLGSTPYGLGTPASAPIPGGAVLRNPATNASTGSRRIDPKTGDYVLDDSGRILGMSDTQQLVFMAVLTVRGSSAMATLGHRLDDIETMGSSFEREVEATYQEALADLVARRLIEIVAIDVRRLHPGAAYIKVRWRDVESAEEHDLEI